MVKKQFSELFGEVFDSHGGGSVRTCACGRVHFSIKIIQKLQNYKIKNSF